MYEYHGRQYVLHESPVSAKPVTHLCNGREYGYRPANKVYVGYIVVEAGIVFIYRDRRLIPVLSLILASTLLAALCTYTVPSTQSEYRVSFSPTPIWDDGTLYCNVVNVSDRQVTVAFTNDISISITILLEPGECLPIIELEFAPTYIVYDNIYRFPLEVNYA